MRSYLRYWMEAFRLPVWIARSGWSAPSTIGERAAVARAAGRRPRGGRRAAAQRQLGPRRRLGGAHRRAAHHGGRAAAARSRCSTGSSRTASGWAWRCCRCGGGPTCLGVLARRLRAGRLVCLLADRDLSASGVAVDFFGEPARMPPGPAVLALQTGAALLPGRALVRRADGLRGPVPPEVPVPAEGAGRGEGRRDDPGGSPTPSRRASPSTRRTGTCCSGSGSPT